MFVALGCLFSMSSRLPAQSSNDDQVATLASRQAGVAKRYERLEELLLRLADMEARENPERSALLRRVAKQSRERFVLEKLRDAGSMIEDGQLSKAMTDQKSATKELQSILQLLMSEDRSTRIRDEKKRISELIKQLRLTERNERSVRARTENGVEMSEVQKEQEAIAERAEELRKELEDENSDGEESESGESESQQESSEGQASKGEPSEKESSKPESSGDQKSESSDESMKDTSSNEEGMPNGSKSESENESQSSDQQSGEQSESESESESSESQSSESQQGESQQSESQQSESQQGESQQSESQQSSQSQSGEQSQSQPPQTPPSPQQQAEEQLQRAIERMKQAQQKLAQNERQEATEQQRQAEEELRQAIDRLEKILRQLREEEMERELAKLEARLRKMATMQAAVLDQTVQLAKTPAVQRNRATDLKAGDLAFEEQKITLEADRAMLLLREEGSSVAFPEVVSQLREDTVRVATRLGQSKIDLVTQGIQNDILAALEEMIAALAKAQRDLEKKKQQEQQGDGGGQPSGSGEEPLVQKLAELKLIRTMQTRIQGSTDRYASLIEEQESSAEDVLPLLRDLSQRQDRLYQITRDLVTERNK
ncbi:hypothetical protein [Rhodopirellula halodulae]|uniref:hypothetical protein n=1 Tax=Rhodopirellula halodulae TaxID=2894198 RepID=UPI001E5CEC57|nr:hypothetical protein [Rhodopirellula sp. JC737]MCC9655492.1 hypothetical protein [Rhodopirellula sp. JC737]